MLIIFCVDIYSQQETTHRKIDYPINGRYRAGEYLIYDCYLGYYACVDDDGFQACQDLRTEAMEKKREVYPCAPLKKFMNKRNCLYENYNQIERPALKRFCYPKTEKHYIEELRD